MNRQHAALLLNQLDALGLWLGLLSLRLLLGWEYWESGLEKLRGENWFAELQSRFPFPFDLISADISWQMATWFELIGSLALIVGVATRFFSLSLLVLTLVAMFSAHWPDAWTSLNELAQGYVFTDRGFGNFKLPVIFMAMLLPLLLLGPGRLSVDGWLRARYLPASRAWA